MHLRNEAVGESKNYKKQLYEKNEGHNTLKLYFIHNYKNEAFAEHKLENEI